MIHLLEIVSPRAVFGDDLPGAMAAQLWDSERKRSLYCAVFSSAGRGLILDPATGYRRWYRDVETLPELIEAVNNHRMIQSVYGGVHAT